MKTNQTNAKLIGNYELITDEESLLATYLMNTYLPLVNESSQSVQPPNTFYVKYFKRILDLLIAIPAFVLFLPLNIILGIFTYFDVGKPIFYKQTRIGKGNQPFILVKFRNMNERKDENGTLLPAKDRVTRFGHMMRRLSLDELLNFWSVIKGDMSIIGPRPLPSTFVERMSERHKHRTDVRPGLECPRMLLGKEDQCLYQSQFENDIWYVENISFTTDIKLLFKLFAMTFSFKKRGKAAEGAGYFAGYDQNGIATTLNRFKRMYPELWKHIKEEHLGES